MREVILARTPEDRRERAIRGARPVPPHEHLLVLQRAAGNRALSRYIKLRGDDVRISLESCGGTDAGVDRKVADEYARWKKAKKIPPETDAAIKALVKSWVLDEEEHALPSGKSFLSYARIFSMARAQVGRERAAVVAPPPDDDVEMPDAAPLSAPSSPMPADEFEGSMIDRFRRAASVERKDGHKRKREEDAEDEEQAERKKRRREDYESGVKPRRANTHGRREQDAAGAVPTETMPYTFGLLEYEIQGGASHRLTRRGGGGPRPYSAIFNDLILASGKSDQELAQAIRSLLQDGVQPTGLALPARELIAELLAVLCGAEMSRSSVALASFAAAIHHVAEGRSTLSEAFVGTATVYLGAEGGGAMALRGTVPRLPAHQRRPMEQQTQRAEPVVRSWALLYTPAGLDDESLDDRLGEISSQLLTNLTRFETSFLLPEESWT